MFKMDGVRPYSSHVSSGSKLRLLDGHPLLDPSKYPGAVGALQYLTWKRLDIALVANQVCQFMHSPTTSHWTAVKLILRCIKGTINHGVFFNKSSSLALT